MQIDWEEIDAAVLGSLGETVSYQPKSGGVPFSVDALFQAPGTPLQAGDIMFEATGPQFVVQQGALADHPDGSPTRGDSITRPDGSVFVVKAVRPDEGFAFILECYDQGED